MRNWSGRKGNASLVEKKSLSAELVMELRHGFGVYESFPRRRKGRRGRGKRRSCKKEELERRVRDGGGIAEPCAPNVAWFEFVGKLVFTTVVPDSSHLGNERGMDNLNVV
ncbi:hypothetical protein TB2_008678 [Malus domestica]